MGIAILIVAAVLWKCIAHNIRGVNMELLALSQRRREAQVRRMEWRKEHPFASFTCDEYQEFWDVEIAAEAAYIMVLDLHKKAWNETSFREWCNEREEYEKSRQ